MNRKKNSNVKGKNNRSNAERSAVSSSNSEDDMNIEEFLSGNRKAFGNLYRTYRDSVYAIAYRFTSNVDDALEITQEVFLKVIINLRKFKRDSSFFTWLYRITVNQSIDYLRQSKKGKTYSLQNEIIPEHREGTNPVKVAEQKESRDCLKDALDQLSEKHRAVITLHCLENITYREIALILDCSMGTVMSRLFYARKQLANILRKT